MEDKTLISSSHHAEFQFLHGLSEMYKAMTQLELALDIRILTAVVDGHEASNRERPVSQSKPLSREPRDGPISPEQGGFQRSWSVDL